MVPTSGGERVANSESHDVREWNHPALVHDAFAKQARPAVGERLPGWLLPGVIDDVRASQGALTGRHVEEPTRRFLDLPTEIPA